MIRFSKNPILTRLDIPEILPHLIDVTSVFNPGAIKYKDKYILILRVQSRSRETFMIVAESNDGIKFQVRKEIIHFQGIEKVKDKIYHLYDARITNIGSDYYIMFAMDMDSGCQLGLAKTDNFENFIFLGITSNEDIRNGVLFPEIINGKFSKDK